MLTFSRSTSTCTFPHCRAQSSLSRSVTPPAMRLSSSTTRSPSCERQAQVLCRAARTTRTHRTLTRPRCCRCCAWSGTPIGMPERLDFTERVALGMRLNRFMHVLGDALAQLVRFSLQSGCKRAAARQAPPRHGPAPPRPSYTRHAARQHTPTRLLTHLFPHLLSGLRQRPSGPPHRRNYTAVCPDHWEDRGNRRCEREG